MAKDKAKKSGSKSEPREVGRPKVSPEDYNPNWKEELEAAYLDGKSDIWVRARCFKGKVISSELWYRWLEEEKEFSTTVKAGKVLSQSYWEDLSQSHGAGINTDANATSLIFNMTNRFSESWKQRQSVEQSTKVSLDMDDADKLAEFLKENGVDVSSL
jgi:hypothetical protein